jgi:hypothetical protein
VSITAIPNQPLSFTDTSLKGCLCDDPEECMLVNNDDTLSFQMFVDDYLGDQLLANTDMDDSVYWDGTSWTYARGSRCATLNNFGGATSLADTSFAPMPGTMYIVNVTASGISGAGNGLDVTFGGVTLARLQGSIADYSWVVTATTTAPLTFTPQGGTAGTKICVSYSEVFEFTPGVEVSIMQGVTEIATIDYTSTPGAFAYGDGRVTTTFDLQDFAGPGPSYVTIADGCYTIRVSDNGTSLESQCINIGQHDCTISVKACNVGDAIGFIAGFSPTMRLYARLTRPKYTYEDGRERGSDGRINVYFADRMKTMELRLGGLGERGHEFVSTLALYDHVYLDRDAYVVKADPYEPAYADVFDAHGDIILVVEPAQFLARKVRMDADDGGCRPPPNYWVQGTGPNEDYVLQSVDGSRILIS